MNDYLPSDRMPEAEVALRLAFHLVFMPGSSNKAEVAIDGASVCLTRPAFPIEKFMKLHGWQQISQKGKTLGKGFIKIVTNC